MRVGLSGAFLRKKASGSVVKVKRENSNFCGYGDLPQPKTACQPTG